MIDADDAYRECRVDAIVLTPEKSRNWSKVFVLWREKSVKLTS